MNKYNRIFILSGVLTVCLPFVCTTAESAPLSGADPPIPAGLDPGELKEAKQQSLDRLRRDYAKQKFRAHSLKTGKRLAECIRLLNKHGVFADLKEEEEAVLKEDMDQSRYSGPQARVSALNQEAFNRIWLISETFRQEPVDTPERRALRAKVFKAIIHYAAIEDGRANVSGGRFHASCFAIPTACINTYFCFFDDMRRVESGAESEPLFVRANRALKTIGFQAWTQPYRNDATDENVVSAERFRKHVWWVGGNALTYRAAFQASVMMNSIPMMDVMAEVAKGALSPVSQTTWDAVSYTHLTLPTTPYV